MTDKQFVLSIYPNAICRKSTASFRVGAYAVYDDFPLSKKWRATAKGAWKHVAEIINNEVMRKLES